MSDNNDNLEDLIGEFFDGEDVFQKLIEGLIVPPTYLEVSLVTGEKRSVLAYKKTDVMIRGNSVEKDVAEGKADVAFLREVADAMEEELTPENVKRVQDEFRTEGD